jgi:two-component system, chemotaxis family, protein-glutamate methylesterase/glutaminase
MTEQIRVLVVDDSAFLRKVVSQMLARSPAITVVGTARDGEDALEMVERHRPDVVTLDLVMPRMNGVEFLREQGRRGAVPVVVCSIAHESGEMALEAFEAGAVEFVQKPTALATDRVYEIADELVAKVEAAFRARRPAVAAWDRVPAEAAVAGSSPAPAPAPASRRIPGRGTVRPSGRVRTDVIVLGISTGGPQALRELIPRFAADFPVPIVMVLHMPVGYTEMYARRLDDISALEVREAQEGDALQPGVVLLAPAGMHLTFVRGADGVRIHLDLEPLDAQHRPSVDVLFRSAADVLGGRVLGVVMTGMGSDGLLGAAHVKAQGGRIVTEAESSCVVYGMPRAVAEASLSDRVATLDEMADAIGELA